MRRIIKKILPPVFVDIYKGIFGKTATKKVNITEIDRIKTLPRYQEGKTTLVNSIIPLRFTDSASLLFMYNELFIKEIYKFRSRTNTPFIIDAGANIGLSIIYFKQLYPSSRIVGFEPDEKIFEVLSDNINVFGLENVQLEKKALWNQNTWLEFRSEGADGGRVRIDADHDRIVRVPAVSLRSYIENTDVDFLKIDIEGSETLVLKDCEDLLSNINCIFIEYHSFIGQEQTLPEILQILKRTGFRYNINTPGLISETPFVHINSYSNMDMQLNIYAWRQP